jgi:WD40 repeat protein
VQSVDISRDGQFAVSGAHDGTVRLWRLPPSRRSGQGDRTGAREHFQKWCDARVFLYWE